MKYNLSLSKLKSNFKEALISVHFVFTSDHIFSQLIVQTLPYPRVLSFWTLIKFNLTAKENKHSILALHLSVSLIFSLFPSTTETFSLCASLWRYICILLDHADPVDACLYVSTCARGVLCVFETGMWVILAIAEVGCKLILFTRE